jgi:hypothetical protein
MALKKLVIDGYGQIEPNNVTFTRDGRVEAQCAPAEGSVFENGMLLAVDTAKREVRLPVEDETLPVALHYSTEKNYTSSALKSFVLDAKSGMYPRMGYLTVGEVFTTNCICYDNGEYTDETALKAAVTAAGTTPVYGTYSTIGAIKVTATKPENGPVLKVARATTMPDGQYAVEFSVIA